MRIAPRIAAALAALLAAQSAHATHPGDTILIASDSTASTYKADRYPQTGWGQMLQCGLSSDVRVSNHAMGGRSTRTFLSEGRWERLLGEVTPGDTVLIQFGHNDQARNKPERWAPAQTDYRNNLMRFIWDVRTAGGTPVLVTPVARRSFGPDGKAKADYPDYSGVMRQLSADLHVPLIDLESLSRAWLDKAGADAAKAYYLHYTPQDGIAAFPKGIADNTHFSEVGARNVANLVAGGLKALNLPISAKVLADRAALARTTPLGKTSCQ
ncbi:G-D-S-L family lipolytic protein [Sphingobium lactosutens]|uniref:rhamnogalacturonan acetylesterase n=1 Tax=Sphingobium lactosutens TaxID=522773 RepID=UPI0015BA4E85|nr:rhamnogalacturonan acetylesterase [Sphingobium lactosutens]NWK97682.1 G-D-S-L family lipolytic protein [Sphingobium lactosutens]